MIEEVRNFDPLLYDLLLQKLSTETIKQRKTSLSHKRRILLDDWMAKQLSEPPTDPLSRYLTTHVLSKLTKTSEREKVSKPNLVKVNISIPEACTLAIIDQELDSVLSRIPVLINVVTDKFRESFGKKGLPVERKPDGVGSGDVVTKVDKLIEKHFKMWVKENYPTHGFLGEESGEDTTGKSPFRWSVDPIDATKNYIHGDPKCCIVFSLLYENISVYAQCIFPQLNETYIARIGCGVRLNGTLVQPTSLTRLEEIACVSSDIRDKVRLANMIGRLRDRVPISHNHASLYDVCSVASRRLVAAEQEMIPVGLGVWKDFGPHELPAALLFARESGCTMHPLGKLPEDFDGMHDGTMAYIIAANHELLQQAIPLVYWPV